MNMRKIIILALLLAGCSKNEPSDDAIKAALNQYNDDIHSGCFEFDAALPATLNEIKHHTLSGKLLDGFASAGLVVASQDGKGTHYKLTPEGTKYYIELDAIAVGLTIRKIKHGSMCVGALEVENITRVIPSPQGNEIKAFYTYKIHNLAKWSTEPEFQRNLGIVAKLVNGQHKDERSEMLYKTAAGWTVRDMRTK
jgi:hypothetical protein